MPLPTFIVIGAMKCGTTSLFRYLALHPEVGVSRVKETNFFIAERNHARGADWYASRFPEGRRARGEASPGYAQRHRFPGVAARMHALLPDAKLVFLARDPLERAISHYAHNVRAGREKHPIDVALADPEASHYVQTSRYAYQLEPFEALYGRGRILAVCSERLRDERRRVLAEVFAFLGVAPGFDDPGFDRLHHTTRSKRRRTWRRPFPARPPKPGAPTVERLRSYLRDDMAALRALTGSPFAAWCR